MCGTGGVLVEAGLVGSDVVGVDAQAKMVAGARENLAHYLETHYLETHYLEDGFAVARGDATRLPFADDAFDGVVFDAPYGRQSKVENDSLSALIGDALAEARRVAARAVVVGNGPYDDAAEAAGWTVDAHIERPVHRSLTRHVHVLR
jgi:tRNA (guanine10-N2)-dimethyltransferase